MSEECFISTPTREPLSLWLTLSFTARQGLWIRISHFDARLIRARFVAPVSSQARIFFVGACVGLFCTTCSASCYEQSCVDQGALFFVLIGEAFRALHLYAWWGVFLDHYYFASPKPTLRSFFFYLTRVFYSFTFWWGGVARYPPVCQHAAPASRNYILSFSIFILFFGEIGRGGKLWVNYEHKL